MDGVPRRLGGEHDGRRRTSGCLAFGPQAGGQGDTVSFDYFWLDGQDTPADPCECEPGSEPGRATSSTPRALDTGKWNAIAHDDATKYAVDDGELTVTTVDGDIYTGLTGGEAADPPVERRTSARTG